MPSQSEPRLILHPGELDALRRRSETSHARFYQALVGDLEGRLGEQPPEDLWGLEEPDYSNLLEICFSLVVNCGIAYHVGQDDRWRGLAERWLRRWVEVGCASSEHAMRSYLVAFHVMALAYGVDLFSGVLPEDFVGRMVAVLTEETGMMVEGMETGESEWSRRYLYHDCWVPIFGIGIGCLALLPYEPRAEAWLYSVEREVTQVVSLLGSDGAWNEGVAPLNYALGPMLYYLEGRKRVFQEPAFEIPWLQELPRWRVYHYLPDKGTYVFLDDSTPSGRYHGETGGVVAAQLYKIASEFQDGLAQQQADWESERRFLKDYHDYGWCFLWYDPNVETVSPGGLPRSAYFPSMGQFFSRSGFGNGASVLSFECTVPGGPLAQAKRGIDLPIETITKNKHAHYRDRASFTFYADGHYFFRPSGYFRFETELKNTLTFDGEGQSLDPKSGGGISGVYQGEEDVYSASRCKAAAAYAEVPRLSAFDRTVMHVRDQHVVFILDHVRFLDGGGHKVDAHFHVGQEVSVETGGDSPVLIRAPSGQSCRLYPACRLASEFEQVAQPVDPYWRDYLSGYDIPSEDLEAMEQVDLRFCFDLDGERVCDILWMILPQGDRGDCRVTHRADSSGIYLWYSMPGHPLQVVVVPNPDASMAQVPSPPLPERPGRVFVLGGDSERHVRVGVEARGPGEWGVVLGEGEVYPFTEAGTVCIED